MSYKTQLLLVLITLLLTASLALAAPAAPQAPQQTPAAAVAPSPAALSPAGPVCKGAGALVFAPAPQTTSNEVCGACSDTACMGLPVNSVCGPDRRCLDGGPSCTVAPSCRCLPIPS